MTVAVTCRTTNTFSPAFNFANTCDHPVLPVGFCSSAIYELLNDLREIRLNHTSLSGISFCGCHSL